MSYSFCRRNFLLNLYICHSVIKSEPHFDDSVNTAWPLWAVCSVCDGLFLWPSCVHCLYTVSAFLQFISDVVLRYPATVHSLFRVK